MSPTKKNILLCLRNPVLHVKRRLHEKESKRVACGGGGGGLSSAGGRGKTRRGRREKNKTTTKTPIEYTQPGKLRERRKTQGGFGKHTKKQAGMALEST
jgi:hypothetical protein